MSTTITSSRPPGGRARRAVAAALSGLLALGAMVVLPAAPASAAPAGMSIQKAVDGGELADVGPGDSFTFSITVQCADSPCEGAQISDPLPPEFVGLDLVSYSIDPDTVPFTFDPDGCVAPGPVVAGCAPTVAFTADLGGGVVGLPIGAGVLSITLQVPDDLEPDWPANGDLLTNTASVSWDNPPDGITPPLTDSAQVRVTVPIETAITGEKLWEPASQQYDPGEPSTITLTSGNASNIAAEQLEIQEPATAPDGAAALDASNPFRVVDFTGFGASALPANATSVTTQAYVFDGATWNWTADGAPSATPTLPPSVTDPAEVGGIRLVYQADIAPVASVTVPIQVAQRATDRNDDSSLVAGTSMTNEMSGTLVFDGEPPVTDGWTAPFEITPLTVAVTPGKSFSPSTVPAGSPSTATLTATNASNGPVDTLTVVDVGFFDDDYLFTGFPGGIDCPAVTSPSPTIAWQIGGVDQAPSTFICGTEPAPPVGTVTGFTVTFPGDFAPGVVATVPAEVTPSTDLVSLGDPVDSRINVVSASATNAAGTATETAPATLDVVFPEVDLSLAKQLSPSSAVEPGGNVLATITATTGSGDADVNPTSIVVEDSWGSGDAGTGDPNAFWNAFDLYSIAATQVPANTTLTIEYQVDGDPAWQTLVVVPPQSSSFIYSMSHAELVAALAPTQTSDVVGIRFTFDNPSGFAQGQSVQPNIGFVARDTLRDGTGPTDTADDGVATGYVNWAHADATAEVAGIDDPIDSGDRQASDDAQIEIVTGSGEGPRIVKRWVDADDHTSDLDALVSQSGDSATTRLGWLVPRPGFDSVVLTDPATPPGGDPEDAAATTFQAFDLLSIDPISFAQDPRLRWDQVTQVELFRSGAWVTVAAPGSWMDATGFVGYALLPEESADTTGVRITILPDDAARAGSPDPTAPAPGEGVASSPSGVERPIDLTWRLRNTVRVIATAPTNPNDPWVTAKHGYNGLDPNVIWNSARLDGDHAVDGMQSATDRDSLTLIDELPGVSVRKVSDPTEIAIPESDDVPAADYPQVTYRLFAENTSPARAPYIRITDPAPCPPGSLDQCVMPADDWDGDPFAGRSYVASENPFEQFDLLLVHFVFDDPGEVSTAASTVTLWHRSASGALSTTSMSIDDVTALGEAELADVVGVSVVYQGDSPETEGGSLSQGNELRMVLNVRLRATARSTGVDLVAGDVRNIAQSQSYDPVLAPDPDDPASTPYASGDATVALTDASLDVVAGKTITPDSVLEVDAPTTDPVVSLTADSGTATASPQQVIITDDDPAFWNGVRLADTPALTATLPDGADRVRVDAWVAGAWVEGPAGATPVLPTVPAGSVQGLRFVFDRADGDVFSHTAPAAPWSAAAGFTVTLLTTQRDGSALPFPGRLDDTATAASARTDGLFITATADADDGIVLDPGTRSLDVVKTQPGSGHNVAVGSTGDWTLEFTNTGTGFVTVDEVVDQLPAALEWDGTPPGYATSTGGTLGTAVSLSSSPDGKTLTFTWPAGANRMSPGETFTITIALTLLPGLAAGESAVNGFLVDSADPLDDCTNASGNAQGLLAGLDADQCGTTNYVQPNPGGALYAAKYVNGDIDGTVVDGEANPSDPSAGCAVDAEGFTRLPCASYSAVGAEDEWKFTVVNAGTIDYSAVTIVDPLPHPGDRMLATGSPRLSDFHPVLVTDSITVRPIIGLDVTTEVTTGADPCTGAAPGSVWLTDPTCDTTAAWEPLAGYAGDAAAITAIRVTIVFQRIPLAPGDSVELRYRTVNEPASTALTDGAPIDVPLTDPGTAWNQAGVTAQLLVGSPLSSAPVQAGVMLLAGDLGVTKVIVGDLAQAPDEFDFQVACTVAGVPLALPDGGALTLTRGGGLRADILGIPLGAECTVSELGDVGAYGEQERFGDDATLTITTPTDGSGDAPVVQTARVQNRYPFPAPPGPPPGPDPDDGGLAGTGVEGVDLLAALGLALIGLGALAIATRRRLSAPGARSRC